MALPNNGTQLKCQKVTVPYLELIFLCLSLAVDAMAEPIDELRQFANDEKDRLDIPGVSVGLIDRGAIEYLALGVRCADADDGVSSADAFSIGSISKPITAWAIMKLAQQGLVSLDAPVGEYLGERWQLPDSGFDSETVTLRRILSHTAGLSARSYQGFPPGSPLTLEDSLNGLPLASSAVRVVVEPGSEYRYSGGGFAVAQLVIENVTGQTFSDFMTNELFEPLGMRDATYLTFEQEALPVCPHDYSGRPITDYRVIEQGAGGLRASAEDLVDFVIANMSPNPVLTQDTVTEMHEPVVNINEEAGSTLGFERRGDLLRHGGNGRGWVASIDFQPASRRGLVILTNSANGMRFVDPVRCKWNELFDVQAALTSYCERVVRRERITHWSLVAVSAALLILATLAAHRTLRAYRSGNSQISFSASKIVRGASYIGAIASIWIVLGTDLVVYWYAVYFYSGVRWGFPTINYLPAATYYVASAFTVLLAVLLCSGFISRRPAREDLDSAA